MIDRTERGPITVLEMKHGRANALDVELCDALAARLDECLAPSTRAVVITGQGRMFSAGVDLLRLLDGGAPYVRTLIPSLCRAFERLLDFPKPMVAAVNGHAIAGGCVIACGADYRIMASGASAASGAAGAESGKIGVPELLVGVPFPTVALEIVRAAVPLHAQRLIYTGRTLSADEAVAEGVVDEVVAPGALLEAAVHTAETLAARPPEAFALTKRQLRAPSMARVAESRARLDRAVEDLWCADSTLDAIRRYVERTLKR
jgi:enoyl-CoA hydratase